TPTRASSDLGGIASSRSRANSLRRPRSRRLASVSRGGYPGNGAAEENSRTTSVRGSEGSRRSGIPPGLRYRAPQLLQTSCSSRPEHAGQARSASRLGGCISEDGVDEGGQGLHGGRQDQQQSGDAQEDHQRNQPPLAAVAPPQASCELTDRGEGVREHDNPARNPSAVLDL